MMRLRLKPIIEEQVLFSVVSLREKDRNSERTTMLGTAVAIEYQNLTIITQLRKPTAEPVRALARETARAMEHLGGSN